MSANLKRPAVKVRFLPHALDRLRERLPGVRREWLKGRLRQRIATELRKGVRVVYGAIKIEVEPGVWVVCVPDAAGWLVVTVYEGGGET